MCHHHGTLLLHEYFIIIAKGHRFSFLNRELYGRSFCLCILGSFNCESTLAMDSFGYVHDHTPIFTPGKRVSRVFAPRNLQFDEENFSLKEK